MELAASPHPYTRSLRAAVRFDARAAGAWTLGFAPVLYLALRGGGYDLIVRSEVGLAAWWVLLLGVIAGVLPLSRIGGLGWVCAGLLGAFALWTGIAIGWSPSAERSMTELGRIVTYVGFLALGLCVLRRNNIRQLVTGMATAFGIVSVLAVLSRLYPSWFAHDQVASFFPGSTSRLNHPLNYANGTGNLLAIGPPLLLATATRARTVVSQAVAAACLPVTVLGIVLTASRGAVLTAVVGIVVFFALAPDRLPKLANAVVAAAGSAIVVDGVLQRSALAGRAFDAARGHAAPPAHRVACCRVCRCRAAASRDRTGRPLRWRPSPGAFAAFALALARRYSGRFDPGSGTLPGGRYYQAWSEPNLDNHLTPQWIRVGRRWVAESPIIYRGLLNAFYAAVKSVHSSNLVITGGALRRPARGRADPSGRIRARNVVRAGAAPDNHPLSEPGAFRHPRPPSVCDQRTVGARDQRRRRVRSGPRQANAPARGCRAGGSSTTPWSQAAVGDRVLVGLLAARPPRRSDGRARTLARGGFLRALAPRGRCDRLVSARRPAPVPRATRLPISRVSSS